MSLLFMDGADDGLSANKWTTGGTRDTLQARTGPASLLIGGGTNGSTSPAFQLGANEHKTVIVGFAIRLVATGNPMGPLQFQGSGVTHVDIVRRADGGFDAYGGGALRGSSPAGLMVPGVWGHLEVKAVCDDAAGRIVAKWNGTTVIDFTGDTRNGGADDLIDRIVIWSGSGAPDRLLNVDDVFICNGAGTINNDFLGDCAVHTLYPNGNGNTNQWVGSDGDSTDNYLLVDEAGVPNTSDYSESGTPGEIDLYDFQDLPGTVTVVKGVASRCYQAKSDTGDQSVRQTARIGATNYPSATDDSLSTSYVGYSRLMEVSPATSNPWTPAEVNGAEFGVEAR